MQVGSYNDLAIVHPGTLDPAVFIYFCLRSVLNLNYHLPILVQCGDTCSVEIFILFPV